MGAVAPFSPTTRYAVCAVMSTGGMQTAVLRYQIPPGAAQNETWMSIGRGTLQPFLASDGRISISLPRRFIFSSRSEQDTSRNLHGPHAPTVLHHPSQRYGLPFLPRGKKEANLERFAQQKTGARLVCTAAYTYPLVRYSTVQCCQYCTKSNSRAPTNEIRNQTPSTCADPSGGPGVEIRTAGDRDKKPWDAFPRVPCQSFGTPRLPGPLASRLVFLAVFHPVL